MAQNAMGVQVPAGSDAFDPQGDMVDLAASLRGRIVVPAANTTARLAVLSNVGSSADAPLLVRQTDTGVYWEHNGTAWRALGGGGTAPKIVVRDADGNAPPAGTVPLIQSFVTQDSRDATGALTVAFPQPFATKPIVQATSVTGSTVNPVVNANNVSTTGVMLIWPGQTGVVRVHVTAIGW